MEWFTRQELVANGVVDYAEQVDNLWARSKLERKTYDRPKRPEGKRSGNTKYLYRVVQNAIEKTPSSPTTQFLKVLYETLDGEQFYDKDEANAHALILQRKDNIRKWLEAKGIFAHGEKLIEALINDPPNV